MDKPAMDHRDEVGALTRIQPSTAVEARDASAFAIASSNAPATTAITTSRVSLHDEPVSNQAINTSASAGIATPPGMRTTAGRSASRRRNTGSALQQTAKISSRAIVLTVSRYT